MLPAPEGVSMGMHQSQENPPDSKNKNKKKAQTKQAKKQQQNNLQKLEGAQTSRLAVFFGCIHSSSTDTKTVTFSCCLSTIVNDERELVIPCSQVGQCQQ